MRKFLFTFLFILTVQVGFAQFSIISGNVRDSKGISIPGAAVFVSGSKTATVTDIDGNFKFTTLPIGSYDLLIQMMGFMPEKKHIVSGEQNDHLTIVLQESTISINEVVIKPDPDRVYYMSVFKNNFIGKTPNAVQCRILNPEVIRFDYNREQGVLNVSATDFLIIENNALGYRIKYLLEAFTSNSKTHIVYYEGYPSFEEIEGSKRMQRKWATARSLAYSGSPEHFYRSLSAGTSESEGFIINKIVNTDNPRRPLDALIDANIKRLMKKQAPKGGKFVIQSGDSLSYWTGLKREPKSLSILNQAHVKVDTLVHHYNDNLSYLNFENDLYVIYTKEKEPDNFFSTGYRLTRPLTMGDFQISQIKALKLPIGFYNSGNLADPTSILTSGHFAYEKVADQVPLEYSPPLLKKR